MADFAAMLTPVRLHPNQALVQRKITPSPEKNYYSGSILMISPTKRTATDLSESPTKKRALAGASGMKIGQTFRAPKSPSEVSLTLRQALNSHCQILFDDFELIGPDGSPRIMTTSERTTILSLFDTAWAAEQGSTYIVLRVEKLPPKPWPYAIAGMPLFVTTSRTDQPSAHHGITGRGPAILGEYEDQVQKNMVTIAKHFHTVMKDQFGMKPTDGFEMLSFSRHFKVSLSASFNIPASINKLPRRIAGLAANYTTVTTEPPREFAHRRIHADVSTKVRDTTNYGNDLRPGVMISNGLQHGDVVTSTGVAVCFTNNTHEKFITAAHHGFRNGVGSPVYHPDGTGNIIGHIAEELPAIDVDLVRLRPGMHFTNEPFSDPNGQQHAVLSRLWPETESGLPPDTKYYDDCYFNSPFSGYIEAMLQATGVKVEVALDPYQVDHVQICSITIGNGDILGTDQTDVIAGVCGTPIIMVKTNEVVGFFRWLDVANGEAKFADARYLTAEGLVLTSI